MKDDAKSKRTASTRRTRTAKPKAGQSSQPDEAAEVQDAAPESDIAAAPTQDQHQESVSADRHESVDPDPPRLDEVSANAPLLAPDEAALQEKRQNRNAAVEPDPAEKRREQRRKIGALNDGDDDDFGPTLAAWLAAYRARQGENEAGAGSAATRQHPPKMRVANRPASRPQTPRPDTPQAQASHGSAAKAATRSRPDDPSVQTTRPDQRDQRSPYVASGPARTAWDEHAAERDYWDEDADAAQAYADAQPHGQHPAWMGPPPHWMVGNAAQSRAPAPRGSRFLAFSLIAILSVGVGAVAVVAAARNNNVDISLERLLAQIDQFAETRFPAEPSTAGLAPSVRRDAVVVASRSEPVSQPVEAAPTQPAVAASAPPAPIAPRHATISVEPTRIVAAPPPSESGRPVSPSSTIGRSTVLLPKEGQPAPAAQPAEQVTAALVRPESAPTQATPAPMSQRSTTTAQRAGSSGAPARQSAQRSVQQPVRVASLQSSALGLASPEPTAKQSSRRTYSTAGSGSESVGRLVERGQKLLELGDVVSARLMFELAANQGSAEGALGAGCTYNPVCFNTLGVRGVAPDPERALRWYRKALEAGAAEASVEIATLESFMTR